jgi:aminoglycoside phosphotransferase (APT) family kinase protein
MRSRVLNVLRSDSERPVCFVHGDAHIGNTFAIPDQEVGFLDWQSSFHGVWAHDVTYFIVTALTVEDRRRSERDLLEEYVAQMHGLGVSLDRDEAWREYRHHVFYACSWSMCLPEWQPEETICLVTERAIAAAADLDSLNA